MQTTINLEPGRYYHIYNRGNNRENIFIEERNYRYFLQLYNKYILPVCDTFAYCLMKNHFHILIRVKATDIELGEIFKTTFVSQQFSNLFNSYAKSINLAYERTGSLFEKGFSRIEIDSDRYFAQLIYYIHFNPQKHGFVEDFRQYPYSSYQAIISKKPTDVCREEIIKWFQGKDNFVNVHELLCDEALISHLTAEC